VLTRNRASYSEWLRFVCDGTHWRGAKTDPAEWRCGFLRRLARNNH